MPLQTGRALAPPKELMGPVIGECHRAETERFGQTRQMHRAEHAVGMIRMKMKICVAQQIVIHNARAMRGAARNDLIM